MPSSSRKTDKASEDTDHSVPWDGGPTTRKAWLDALPGIMANSNSKYRTLWQRGAVYNTRSGKTIVQSDLHRFHHWKKNIKLHEFHEPFRWTSSSPARRS